jgi:dipeptidyl-peptidase-4
VAKIGVIDLESGKTTWIDTGADTDVYLARMEWADSPSELIIQRLNRHQNRNDLLLADAATGKSRTLLSDTDKAWVEIDADPAFINDGKQFIWASEEDGYKHLYLYNRDGTLARQITKGPWEVTGFYGYDDRSGWLYFSAAEKSPLERHLYRIRLDGKRLERITRDPGTHSINFNSGFRYYIDTYSRAGVPPAAGLYQVDGKPVRTLVDNARVAERLASARLRAPEFFTFKTSDGVELNGSMIKPADFDPAKKYPVLMYVYGGPGSQMVTDAWGGVRYLWHQHLAQKGVVVVTIDNRGTGGRGSAFKKATYLNLGKWETHDQIEGARYLARLPYVDPARIGIWGWSYGGYMTALTLMKGGDLFRAGISVAPVTDWKLYDSIYTERFMRTPKENPEGYRESAPVEQVEGLKSRFLLIHGTLDDNVHFQNAIQLASALQRAGKQFDFMAYPNRNHSISGGNTSLHLYTLMTDWVQKNLVGGQVMP